MAKKERISAQDVLETISGFIEVFDVEKLKKLDKLDALDELATIKTKQEELEKKLLDASSIFEAELENVENLKSQIIDKTAEITSLQSKIVNYNILINFLVKAQDIVVKVLTKYG